MQRRYQVAKKSAGRSKGAIKGLNKNGTTIHMKEVGESKCAIEVIDSNKERQYICKEVPKGASELCTVF